MSYKELIDNVYNDLKSEGRKVYKKEIKQYIDCYKAQDYTPMFDTDLYINRGTSYCRMIENINEIERDFYLYESEEF